MTEDGQQRRGRGKAWIDSKFTDHAWETEFTPKPIFLHTAQLVSSGGHVREII